MKRTRVVGEALLLSLSRCKDSSVAPLLGRSHTLPAVCRATQAWLEAAAAAPEDSLQHPLRHTGDWAPL